METYINDASRSFEFALMCFEAAREYRAMARKMSARGRPKLAAIHREEAREVRAKGIRWLWYTYNDLLKAGIRARGWPFLLPDYSKGQTSIFHPGT